MSDSTKMVQEFIVGKIKENANNPQKAQDLTRMLFFINKEVAEASNFGGMATTRDFLAEMISNCNNEKIVEIYLDQVIADTKRAENNQEYARMFRDFYQRFVLKSPLPANALTENKLDAIYENALCGVISALSSMPPKDLSLFIEVCENGLKGYLLTPLGTSGRFVKQVGSKVAAVSLVIAELGYEIVKNMLQWWRGQISGMRCAKNIMDSSASIFGGALGGYAGANACACAAAAAVPAGAAFGSVIGGLVGAIGGGYGANRLMEKITEGILNLPKTVAEEKAYEYMGVDRNASNDEINKVYHKKALQYHPDRGGNKEDFFELQMHLQIIRMARGYDS